ncbi:hypothetical protein ACH6CV_01935 [Bacillota bacterium Meth-B3]
MIRFAHLSNADAVRSYSWMISLWGLPWFKRRGVRIECVQTDNGFEFTNRFSPSKRASPTLFEETAAALGIRHKLIRPLHAQAQRLGRA